MSKSRLGKGLGALITDNDDNSSNDKVMKVFVENIKPNPFQPRQEFEEKSLKELGQSIKENGIIQPITVRQVKPDQYQLVAGERRWRASILINMKKIPAIVKELSDHQMMEIALIENLQREDLNPIEEAQAYQKMMDEFNMTQAQVAKKVGKSRSSIANAVRLLNLAPKIQVYVSRGTLTMGHARALLALKESDLQIKAGEYIIDNNLSVRKTEKYINRLKNYNSGQNKVEKRKNNNKEQLDYKWVNAKEKLSKYLGTKVKIDNKKNKKIISIECKNFEDVENILERVEQNVSHETF